MVLLCVAAVVVRAEVFAGLDRAKWYANSYESHAWAVHRP